MRKGPKMYPWGTPCDTKEPKCTRKRQGRGTKSTKQVLWSERQQCRADSNRQRTGKIQSPKDWTDQIQKAIKQWMSDSLYTRLTKIIWQRQGMEAGFKYTEEWHPTRKTGWVRDKRKKASDKPMWLNHNINVFATNSKPNQLDLFLIWNVNRITILSNKMVCGLSHLSSFPPYNILHPSVLGLQYLEAELRWISNRLKCSPFYCSKDI